MRCDKPPEVIYLQVRGQDKDELPPDSDDDRVSNGWVTWCEDKIFDTDVRYIIDRRYLKRRKHGKS